MARRRFPGYAWIPGVLLLMVLVAPVSAGNGTWTTNGPFATGLSNLTIFTLAISPDGSVIYCGTGSGSVFSYTFGVAAPVAGFTGTPVSGSYPLFVQFNDTSTGSPTSWSWDFGDGTTSAEQNATHTYTKAGSFTVRLTATNTAGSDTFSRSGYITITEPITANFTGTPTSGTAPLTVAFTDTSTGSPTSWSWDFGDGNTSAEQNPLHTYSMAGTFRVNLTVTNTADSDTFTRSGYITITEPLTANFTGTPVTGSYPLSVQFTDTSTGTPTSWLWDFGDGTTSAEQNATHTYTRAGSFTVNLTATNTAGSDTFTRSGYVTVTEPLTANFTGTPVTGTYPLSVQFTDTSTGTPTSWLWDFGDGNMSTSENPSHTYSMAGSFTVNLTATNTASSDTFTRSGYITVTEPLTANFTGTPVTGSYPLSVQFTDTSTGSPAAWGWDFGDGTTSAEQNATHTYSRAGSFTVNLTVTNTAGSDTFTRSGYITVTEPLTANFTGTPVTGSYPLSVQFTDMSTGTPTSWLWDFGDGNTSTSENPSHTYTMAGSFTVNLTATNTAGSDTFTRSGYITVTEPLTANFTGTPVTGSYPISVQFTDMSTGTPTSWLWDFGDGNTSTSENPSHTYTQVGAFTLSLTARDGSASDTKLVPGYITVTSAAEPVIANFAAVPRTGTAPLTVSFTDQSQGGPLNWSWSFGDGGTSTEQNPVHTYTQTGSFLVSLTAVNGSYSNTTMQGNYITVTAVPVTTPTTSPMTTTTTVPVTTPTTSPVTTTTTVPVTTTPAATGGAGAGTSGDTGRATSFVATSPGTPAGGTMTFAVNEPLSVDSTGYSYAIRSVSIVPGETLGSTDMLVTDAGSTSHAPDGRTVAGIVAISPVGVNPSSISSGTITFAVSESWLTDHGLTSADIVMLRYHDGVWAELPTTYQYEAGGACYFTATTPGFSYFAIAARTGTVLANATVTGTTAASVPVSSTQVAATTSAVPSSANAAPAGTSAPVTTATTAVPAETTGSSGIPFLTLLAGIGGIAVVVMGAVLVPRWWIRRQNPALFKKYD